MRGFEIAGHEMRFGKFDRQCRIRSVISEEKPRGERDIVVFDALADQVLRQGARQFEGQRLEVAQGFRRKAALDRLLAARTNFREPHAVGREHAREGMNEDCGHVENVGDEAGVLPARGAEAVQGVCG